MCKRVILLNKGSHFSIVILWSLKPLYQEKFSSIKNIHYSLHVCCQYIRIQLKGGARVMISANRKPLCLPSLSSYEVSKKGCIDLSPFRYEDRLNDTFVTLFEDAGVFCTTSLALCWLEVCNCHEIPWRKFSLWLSEMLKEIWNKHFNRTSHKRS